MNLVENPFARYRVNDADDFEPSWDVPSYGQRASDAIIAACKDARKNPDPSGSRRIIVLSGPSGYGKSHLFGRVQHQMRDEMNLVYVPMTNDPSTIPTGDHVRWKLVESLFDNRRDFATLRRLLAKFLQPSFVAFFEQLPEKIKKNAHSIWQELKDDSLNVLGLLSSVHDLAPYHRLADSIRQQFPGLSLAVLRALILGLSPAAKDVQTWLRGEQECLSDERLQELLLTDRPPDVTEVIRAVALLFQRSGKVLLLCLDQLELLFRHKERPIETLVAQLMAWLQDIPNLVISLGCLSDSWHQVIGEGPFEAFRRRTEVVLLTHLQPDQAVELVVKRMNSWDGRSPQHPQGWPCDLESVRRLAKEGLSPGALIGIGAKDLASWHQGDTTKPIHLGGQITDSGTDLVLDWKSRLEKFCAKKMTAGDYQEAEIFEAFRLALEVGQVGKIGTGGLKESPTSKKPSCPITIERDGKKLCVLLTFTKKDGGSAFGGWVTALEEALTKFHAVGVVAVWPKKDLSVRTGVGLTKYNALKSAGKVRPYSIEEPANLEVFRQVMTLREAMLDAESGQFLLGGKPVAAQELFKQIREAKLLDGLNFFEYILNDWQRVEIEPISKATPSQTLPTSTAPLAATSSPASPVSRDPLQEQLTQLVQFLVKKKQAVIADGVEPGPTFIRFRVRLEADADVARIQKQAKNLQTQMGLDREPIIDNHAGFVSIDVQRKDRQTVHLASLLTERPANAAGRPIFPAGKDVAGKITWIDLSEPTTCHLLVAGITGSGKSEFLKTILASLSAFIDPSRIQFALIDPKRVTFNFSGASPYLMGPVIHDAEEAVPLLKRCRAEMHRRYQVLQIHHKAKIDELPVELQPARWIIVFDEFANLMDDKGQKKELEGELKALSGMARAAGIHLILGTQRPEASVVTPLLRTNLPCRIGFQVATGKDSNIIIDQKGAEHLLGKGDFLLRLNASVQRLQSPFVAPEEFEKYLRMAKA